ncbi:GTP-binding protein LepA [Luteococcus sp. OSA5]|uniref:GTP-binding protein LepA n=1 Tax=Luteococcus sp. OSA5 TaxID=3401630 RepID=UPI003B43BACC
MRRRFATTIDYLGRVELEVERNLLELLLIMPEPHEVDRFFYADVWGPQELAHGRILDQLQDDLGLRPTPPVLEVGLKMKVLGALSHLGQVQDVSRLLYYLTGASTERQAVLAYSEFVKGLEQMGERAIAETIIRPIKQQEPGHFAFYRLSAQKMIQDGELRPWQLHFARLLRSRSYNLVGTNGMQLHKHQMGEVIHQLGFDEQVERYAKEIGRLEANLLWAHHQGMDYPPYILEALRESVQLYRERGSFEPRENHQ